MQLDRHVHSLTHSFTTHTHSHLEMCAWAWARTYTNASLRSVFRLKEHRNSQMTDSSSKMGKFNWIFVCAHRTVTCTRRVWGRLSDVKMRQTIHSYCIRCLYELSASSQPGTGFGLDRYQRIDEHHCHDEFFFSFLCLVRMLDFMGIFIWFGCVKKGKNKLQLNWQLHTLHVLVFIFSDLLPMLCRPSNK